MREFDIMIIKRTDLIMWVPYFIIENFGHPIFSILYFKTFKKDRIPNEKILKSWLSKNIR